jgi:lysophospholipase L1-like esterase
MFKEMLGTRKGSPYRWRIVAPIVIIFLSLFAFSPSAFAASHGLASSKNQPTTHYLALGDSLAFGVQPNKDFTHGYVNDIFNDLKSDGVKDVLNLGCPGESSVTMINGGCPFGPPLPYTQLGAALGYLHANAGQVSLVTLDIGANDLLNDANITNCTILPTFTTHLAILDANLNLVILPLLHTALMVNGHLTGKLVMMNYYDPYQNICPNLVKYTRLLNQHLAADVQGFGNIVNVFQAFGGSATPNPHICKLTWMCAAPPLGPNIHATTRGYQVIADTFLDHIEN